MRRRVMEVVGNASMRPITRMTFSSGTWSPWWLHFHNHSYRLQQSDWAHLDPARLPE